jgi:hypothetical protein
MDNSSDLKRMSVTTGRLCVSQHRERVRKPSREVHADKIFLGAVCASRTREMLSVKASVSNIAIHWCTACRATRSSALRRSLTSPLIWQASGPTSCGSMRGAPTVARRPPTANTVRRSSRLRTAFLAGKRSTNSGRSALVSP